MRLEISSPSDYRAALYIRLSKEDESEGPSQSVTNQQALLHAFVQQQRLTVHDIYIDDGFSGTSFDRPAFRRMIADIEAGHVNMVITKDLSRLGRDYIMTGHYMERYFPEKRVRYISLLDGVDTGVESTANDITPFRAIMNDMYAKDISRKIRSVKHDKQRRGQFIGGKPMYGYRMHPTEKNRIVIDEEAAQVVRRIFAMALEGVSCRQIALQLNRERIPAPSVYAGLPQAGRGRRSGLWSSERISEMLRNETYLGHMVQGRTVKVSYKSKKCRRQPPEDWVVVKGTHEPLIGEDAFRRVQQLLSSRRHTRSRTYDFLLKGLICCHECGSPLAVINRPNAAGEDRLFFVCRTYQRFTGAGVCTCHSIREQTATDAVIASVKEVCRTFLTPERLQPIAEEILAQARQAGSREEARQALRNRIAVLNDQLDRMYIDRLGGLLADADFRRIHHRIEADRRALEERLKQLEEPVEEPVTIAEEAAGLVQQYLASACSSRELLVSLLHRVELTSDRQIILHFRFCDPEAAVGSVRLQ